MILAIRVLTTLTHACAVSSDIHGEHTHIALQLMRLGAQPPPDDEMVDMPMLDCFKALAREVYEHDSTRHNLQHLIIGAVAQMLRHDRAEAAGRARIQQLEEEGRLRLQQLDAVEEERRLRLQQLDATLAKRQAQLLQLDAPLAEASIAAAEGKLHCAMAQQEERLQQLREEERLLVKKHSGDH